MKKINIFKKFIFVFLLMIFLLPNVFSLIQDANMTIFAVSGENTAKQAKLNINIVDGSGKIFSSIDESIVGSSTQESFKNAVSVTQNIVGGNLKSKYNYTIDIESNSYSIDGPSAGGAMALLMISMFKDKPLSKDVSMTGTINLEGQIGNVGGIYQKTKKAGEIGIKLFFIPTGNRTQVITENGKLKQIDLVFYAYEKWGLKVIEVNKIQEALDYAFMDISSIDINNFTSQITDDFVYQTIENSQAVLPFKEVTLNQIQKAKDKLEITKNNLDSSDIKDTSILQSLFTTIFYSEELINVADKFYENNYLYSAANNAFLAYINVITVDEIINNPSLLSDSSIAFSLRLNNLDDKITLIENKTNECALENLEWCIGAKQRITWARDKLTQLKDSPTQGGLFKIQDYAYAVSWAEIADDFLNIANTSSDIKFVESNHFKQKAQNNIISVENQLVLTSSEVANSEDLKRRLNAAKINYERGWYVTSLYDSASALAVIKTQIEKENLSQNVFVLKYNDLYSKLKSSSSMSKKNNVWSKIFLDHATYYYNSYNEHKAKNDEKSVDDMEVSNSILNFSLYLLDVENQVLDYYLNIDISTIIVDVPVGGVSIVDNDKKDSKQASSTPQNVYVYSSDKKDNTLYFLLFVLVLIILIMEIRNRDYYAERRLIKKINDLDLKLIAGRISPFAYKALKEEYMKKYEKIKNKNSLSVDNKQVDKKLLELETQLIDKQILELEEKKKSLSLKVKEKPLSKPKQTSSVKEKKAFFKKKASSPKLKKDV